MSCRTRTGADDVVKVASIVWGLALHFAIDGHSGKRGRVAASYLRTGGAIPARSPSTGVGRRYPVTVRRAALRPNVDGSTVFHQGVSQCRCAGSPASNMLHLIPLF